MRSVILGSYIHPLGTKFPNGAWVIESTPEEPSGITALERRLDGVLVCCFGDRTRSFVPEPKDGSIGSWVTWCKAAMLRHCGAICEPRTLTLWTDESAGCPMFYSFDQKGQPLFSTRARLIASLLPWAQQFSVPPGIRPIPAEGETVFTGVHAVPPGSLLTFKLEESRWSLKTARRYFRFPAPEIRDMEVAREITRRVLETSVKRAVDKLSRVCITLSGGVDSSAVAAIAGRLAAELHTFTAGSEFSNEFAQAAEVSRLLGAKHRKLVMKARDLDELLPELIRALETWDPVTLQIAAPAAFIYKQAQVGQAVFLTGYGADLLFAGVGEFCMPEHLIEESILRQVRLTAATNEFSPNFADEYGITVRYPYWSPSMVRSALSMRAGLKVREGTTKYVLRSAALGWLPARVAWRAKVGIHEGSSMHRLFSECLGDSSLEGQCEALRSLARRELLQVAAAPPRAERKVAACASF